MTSFWPLNDPNQEGLGVLVWLGGTVRRRWTATRCACWVALTQLLAGRDKSAARRRPGGTAPTTSARHDNRVS